MGWVSSVDIATHQGLDGAGIKFRWGQDFTQLSTRPWGPPSFLNSGYRVYFSGIRQSPRGVDKTPHLVPMLKEEYNSNFTPLLGVHGRF